MSRTSLHLNDLLPLLSCLPNLQFLSISSNSFGDVPIEPFSHASLQTLDLSSNQISSWSQIASVASISSLQTIYLNSNPLGGSLPTCVFSSIRSLHISSVGISSLAQLMNVVKFFPSLRELEMSGNECYKEVGSREVPIWCFTADYIGCDHRNTRFG